IRRPGERLGEARVDALVRADLGRIVSLDHEEHRALPAILPGDLRQLANVPRAAGRDGVGEVCDVSFDEGDALHLEGEATPVVRGEDEIEAGGAMSPLGTERRPTSQLGQRSLAQGMGNEAVRERRIDRDQSVAVGALGQDRAPGGPPGGVVAASQPEAPPRDEQVREAARVREVGGHHRPILHATPHDETVRPLDERRGLQRPVDRDPDFLHPWLDDLVAFPAILLSDTAPHVGGHLLRTDGRSTHLRWCAARGHEQYRASHDEASRSAMATTDDTKEGKPASGALEGAASLTAFLLGRGDPPPEAVIRAARLEGYAYVALPSDHPLRARLRANYLGALARHEAIKREIAPLFRAWNDAGITPLLMKGFHMAEFVYPAPGMRFHGDVDVVL